MVDIPRAAAVVPGTEFMLFQQLAAEIFHRENQAHISQSAHPDSFLLKQSADGGQDGSTAIDRKHPQGSIPHQGHISPAQGVHGSKYDFHAPAYETAFEKVFDKGDDTVFHENAPFTVPV